MLFKEYLDWLNQLLKERPELATAIVVEDTWQTYTKVRLNPRVWYHYPEYNTIFLEEDTLFEGDEMAIKGINAVCIN